MANKYGIDIAKLRRDANMTQKELGDRIGTHQGNISKLEHDLSHARMDTLIKLAAALGKVLKVEFVD